LTPLYYIFAIPRYFFQMNFEKNDGLKHYSK
jgi:hypothetical protein